MPHTEAVAPMEQKTKDKVTGFNVKFLDDGTFLVDISNDDWNKRKQYSYESFSKMMSDLSKDFGKKKDKGADNLSKY